MNASFQFVRETQLTTEGVGRLRQQDDDHRSRKVKSHLLKSHLLNKCALDNIKTVNIKWVATSGEPWAKML